jgi:exo-1,4-beta-D-glucosaminidase
MFEAYGRNKYTSTGVIQWMLNNAWPSMIWHLYDYYLDAGAGYFAAKKACEPLHIQYSYDDHSIAVVNSTYATVTGMKASVQVHNGAWKELYKEEVAVDAGVDSAQLISSIPDGLFTGADRLFFIDLKLTDAEDRVVSRNFYWVPGTLTSFDWAKTDFTHTPAARHEDLTALASLPQAKVTSHAEIEKTAHGREVQLRLDNSTGALAFQLHAAIRTHDGGLIAPVLWSDNWIELAPGESRTLTAILPDGVEATPIVQVEGWNVAAVTLSPTAASASIASAH